MWLIQLLINIYIEKNLGSPTNLIKYEQYGSNYQLLWVEKGLETWVRQKMH